MNRRSFFSAVGGASAETAVPDMKRPPMDPGAPRVLRFPTGEWKVYWTGWETIPFQDAIVGFWIAQPLGAIGGGARLYCCSHGRIGSFWPDSGPFDISIQEGQAVLDRSSTEEEREKAKRAAWGRLIAALRELRPCRGGHKDWEGFCRLDGVQGEYFFKFSPFVEASR